MSPWSVSALALSMLACKVVSQLLFEITFNLEGREVLFFPITVYCDRNMYHYEVARYYMFTTEPGRPSLIFRKNGPKFSWMKQIIHSFPINLQFLRRAIAMEKARELSAVGNLFKIRATT
ncbi:hypothetical protein BJ170DRAFT_599344 [Xylariales sp. AK1849]|nr:hypothetical protein BJ170DRAFT_599344 [Xylariales sp. AK1849]